MLESQRNRPDNHQRYRFESGDTSKRARPLMGHVEQASRETEAQESFFSRIQKFHAAKVAEKVNGK
jgi:hypothetical protein